MAAEAGRCAGARGCPTPSGSSAPDPSGGGAGIPEPLSGSVLEPPAAIKQGVPDDHYEFTKNDRLTLVSLFLVFVVAVLIAMVPWLSALVPACFTWTYLNLHCPGCGLTRAVVSLARGDLSAAFNQNLLVFFVIPVMAWKIVSISYGALTSRKLLSTWPRGFLAAYQYAFIAAWFLVFLVRLASWINPDLNPNGWLLPLSL